MILIEEIQILDEDCQSCNGEIPLERFVDGIIEFGVQEIDFHSFTLKNHRFGIFSVIK